MKKFFSAILLMTMMVFSVGTFVSCNDLVNEIEGVKGQTTELEAAVDALEAEIATLETALQNAKAEAAAAAKTAADAAAKAQETGDKALKAAQDAAAAAAAAQASADAIEETLADAKTALQAAIDGKADKADVEAAVKDIKALQAALEGKADKTDVDALKAELDLLKKTLEGYKDLLAQLEILTPTLDERINYNLEAVTNAQGTADANAEEIAALKDQINDLNSNLTKYTSAIVAITEMIQSVVYVPETADGTMVATGYQFGANAKSDLIVKATYEITPAKYAEELTNANLSFTTVPVKAAPAEIVEANLIEAKNGRVTVYARIKKGNANKETYAALTSNGAAALALVISDETNETVDSVDVTVGTNIQSEYTTVYPVDADGFVPVQNLVKIYRNDTGKWVEYDNSGSTPVIPETATNSIKVPYTDTAVKNPLSIYELRFDIQGVAMTPEQASTFIGYNVAPVPAAPENYTFGFTKPITTSPYYETVAANAAPFKVEKAGFASSVQLKAPKDKNLKDYIDYTASVTLPAYYIGTTPCLNAVPVTAKVAIDYTEIADITIETYDAGKWSYRYFNGTDHVLNLTKADGIKELDVTSSVALKDLTYLPTNTTLTDSEKIENVTVVADYVDAYGNDQKSYGKVSFKVLNSKSVMLTAVELPFIDQPLVYKANFQLVNTNTSESYTVAFTTTLAERPASQVFSLGTIEYNGLIKTNGTTPAVSVPVSPIAMIREAHGAYYADLFGAHANAAKADKATALATINGEFDPVFAYPLANPAPTATLAKPSYKHDANYNLVEETEVTVSAVNAYGSEYTVNHVVTFAGIQYLFTGKVVVNKPAFGIKNSSLLINPSTNVGEVLGDVVYPKQATGSSTVSNGTFSLNTINLRDYVVITKDGAVANEELLDSEEFELLYELISTTGNDDNNDGDLTNDIIPGVSYTTTRLASSLDEDNIVNWVATNGYTAAKFRVSLVANNGAKVKNNQGADVDDVFGTTEFTLQIPDLVTMSAKTIKPVEFVAGTSNPVSVNVVKGLSIKDYNDKSLVGSKAADFSSLWAQTAGGSQWQMYHQVVSLAKDADNNLIKPTAVVESTGDPLFFGANKDFFVDDEGNVTLLKTDLNIQSNVVVTVPVQITHDYADKNDSTNYAEVKVTFTPTK